MILFNKKTLLICFIVLFYILLKDNNIIQKDKKYYKNQYLILFSQDIINKQEVLNLFDLQITQNLGEWILVNKKNTISYAVSLDDETTKLEQGFIEQLQEHPLIHSASLNFVDPDDSCNFCANDKINTSNNLAWHLTKEYGINITQAWDITQGDKNNVLAIVDRNFVFPQKFLCQNKSYYHQNILDFVNPNIKDKDNTPHGLEILSVLGCNAQENILGIDLKTSLMAVDSQFDKSLSTRMLGILWAAGLAKNLRPNLHPAKVINASFGFIVNDTKNVPFGPVLDTITDLNNHNITLVASAGNESSLADNRLPGSLAGVISVGASKDRKSTRLNSSHTDISRMPSSA